MPTWKLLLPTAVAAALCVPATASAMFTHVIAPGESLSSVAAADGLSVAALAAANGLSPDTQLVAGTTLGIPPQDASSAAAAPTATSTPATDGDGDSDTDAGTSTSTPTASVSSSGGYLVQPGDTLSAIAARYGVSAEQLAADNGLDPAGLLLAGSTLNVSGLGPASSAAASSSATSSAPAVQAPEGTAATNAPGGAQPTAESVSPSEVGTIAADNGVPASLAEAIGYQESGFNNNEVSNTGATGVMQIEPGTWNYIGQNLAGPSPLSPSSATDNIRGGVLLLRSLLAQTGGDPSMAAAGYYQGLQSVREHGMYADTEQYVNNVMALQQRFGGG
jgi:N-acetylmuramoyl-L-alanine amidase